MRTSSEATDEPSQLRPTLWPGVPVPVPPPFGSGGHDVDPDGWVHWYPPFNDAEPLPDEFVLRDLLAVDHLDGEAVVELVSRHGVIGRPPGEMGLPLAFDMPKRPAEGVIHRIELRLYIAFMQAAVNHWRAYMTGGDVVEAWADIPGLPVEVGDEVWQQMFVADEKDAWMRLTEVVNAGCAAYRVRAELTSPDIPSFTLGAPKVGLFSAMCLQLYNLMVEELPPKRCANETCGTWFVRQQGRSEKGLHRVEGVSYCMKTCARAQAERERRRRQRKERG